MGVEKIGRRKNWNEKRICCDQYMEGEPQKRTKKIEIIYKEPKITSIIKAQRIRCLEHVRRLENDRMTNIVVKRKSIGKRRKGRPRKIWLEGLSYKKWILETGQNMAKKEKNRLVILLMSIKWFRDIASNGM